MRSAPTSVSPRAQPSPAPRASLPDTARRMACEANGRLAEWAAALVLLLRGYRVLALRRRTPYGEIDLIAVRGRRLAFIEVKQRATRAAADAALSARQTRRLHAAAAHWTAERPFYRDFEIGFDSVFVVPGCWPDYRRDALQPLVTSRSPALG